MIDYSKWSSNLAYAVGLIATDGNLSGDGRHLDLTSKDIEQLDNFQKCLEISHKVSFKTSGYSDKKYPRLQFSDVKFYHWLQSIGLTPKKSKIIGALSVPDQYFFDFLRGSFDGDGCIYAYWDKRWRSSYMFYVVFVSASRDHLAWINSTLNKQIGIEGRIGIGGGIFKLSFAKSNSKKIIEKMYQKKDCISLFRKKDKVFKILNMPGW